MKHALRKKLYHRVTGLKEIIKHRSTIGLYTENKLAQYSKLTSEITHIVSLCKTIAKGDRNALNRMVNGAYKMIDKLERKNNTLRARHNKNVGKGRLQRCLYMLTAQLKDIENLPNIDNIQQHRMRYSRVH